MTIARRLILLVAVPLFILLGIWGITRVQMARVEDRIRFVAESRVVALARLGDISRSFAELRVNVRSFVLATNQSAQAAARKAYDIDRADLDRLLADYADKRVTSDQGRRFLNDYRAMSWEWMVSADRMMKLVAAGRNGEAVALMSGSFAETGAKLSNTSREWIKHNEDFATRASQEALDTIEQTRRNLLIATSFALALAGFVRFLTFRRIVKPIQALEPNPKRLRRIASYGLGDDAQNADSFRLGEGLIGQCAREQKPVTLVNLPLDYLRSSSGLSRRGLRCRPFPRC